ncbi:hypothetical protein B0H65DRAFT_569719 [Neurospora tetraspora]|uniref:Uncharacterized protein n=1 Tax=Neurospora tetraspora TaxID=94610 RepID=A0AAE0MWF7_9PEZI|nr:hypothetical protein B0H65DRAFT_569719 [Neurospora tetraspora]
MNPVKQTASPPGAGWAPIECLPQGILERIAEFHGDIVGISPNEQAGTFTHPHIDSAASDTWQPRYNDLRSLALTSTSFAYPAQRALRYVRYLVTFITDYVRPLPIRFIPPQPLVLSEFMRNIYPLLSTPIADALPEHSFLRGTLKNSLDTLIATDSSEWGGFLIHMIGQTGVNFHTIEDQVLTTALQLCPRLAATRLCFGEPRRHSEGPEPANQTAPNILIYSSLINNCPSYLKSLTLDFGALYSLTNFKSHVPGYPPGCPPSVERLTLVGNRVESELPYEAFTIEILSAWLGTNMKLRELRLVDDFDKMIRYTDIRESNNATSNSEQVRMPNWNDVLRSYKDTLEVLVMGWDRPSAIGMKARFGASGKLDCLPEMGKLRYLKAPLIALGGNDFIVPLGPEDGKLIESVRTGLPANLRKLDLMVVNPPQTRAERTTLKWRVVECRL